MNTEKTKESFVMYDSFIQAGEFLPAEDFKNYILKMRDYALYNDDTPSENQVVNALMTIVEPLIKSAENRRKQAIINGSKGKQFGSEGGSPRKGETREEYDERRLSRTPKEPLNNPQITPKEPLNVNDNVNVDDKENVNEEVKVKEKVNEKVDGKVNAVGVNDNNVSSPSSISSSSSSLSSDSSLPSDSIEHLDNKDTNTPIDISKEEDLEKNNSNGGGTAAASEGESLSKYYWDVFGENIAIVKDYRLNHKAFDERYKKAHNTAVHSYMEITGYTYEVAREAVEDALKQWYQGEIASKNN